MPAKYIDPFDNGLPYEGDEDTQLYSYVFTNSSLNDFAKTRLELEVKGIVCTVLEWTDLGQPRVLLTKATADKLKTLYNFRLDGPEHHKSIQTMSSK